MNLQEFQAELNRGVRRISPDATGNARFVANYKRRSDNVYVIEGVAYALGITNVRNLNRAQLIRTILEREQNRRLFTDANQSTSVTSTGSKAAASTAESDSNCAIIDAGQGVVVRKTLSAEANTGFKPYAIRFNVTNQDALTNFRRYVSRAIEEYTDRRQRTAANILRPLLAAIDAKCPGSASTEETVLSQNGLRNGFVVQKVQLAKPTVNTNTFVPFTIDIELNTEQAHNTFTEIVRYADRNFCSEKSWLFAPVNHVMRG